MLGVRCMRNSPFAVHGAAAKLKKFIEEFEEDGVLKYMTQLVVPTTDNPTLI
jgi:hypothetical protein